MSLGTLTLNLTLITWPPIEPVSQCASVGLISSVHGSHVTRGCRTTAANRSNLPHYRPVECSGTGRPKTCMVDSNKHQKPPGKRPESATLNDARKRPARLRLWWGQGKLMCAYPGVSARTFPFVCPNCYTGYRTQDSREIRISQPLGAVDQIVFGAVLVLGAEPSLLNQAVFPVSPLHKGTGIVNCAASIKVHWDSAPFSHYS